MQNRDDFDDPQVKNIAASIFKSLDVAGRIRARGPLFTILPLAAMAVLLASVLWYSYPREVARQEMMAVPVVHADASPYRVAPHDPGGMTIPYRDSTVFETIRAAQNDKGTQEGEVENLLPEPEKPIARGDMFAGLKTDPESLSESGPDEEDLASAGDAATAPVAEDVTETDTTQATPEKKPATPSANVNMADASDITAPAETGESSAARKSADDSAAKAARTEPAAGPATANAIAQGKKAFVQLGSLRSESDARSSWKKFQASFPAQLGALDVRVQKTDLGARGVYYRVQGGPVSEQKAKDICQAVQQKRPGGCLVVRD